MIKEVFKEEAKSELSLYRGAGLEMDWKRYCDCKQRSRDGKLRVYVEKRKLF